MKPPGEGNATIDPIKAARKLWNHSRVDHGRIAPEPAAVGVRSITSDLLQIRHHRDRDRHRYKPKSIAACSHAEWAASRALAERNANRWRKQPDVDTIEILDAIQV